MNRERAPNFAELIRRSRDDAGLTQEGLAERAGVSTRTISDLERGLVRAPRKDTLELLASALALSADERDHWERERQRLSQRSAADPAPTGASVSSSSGQTDLPVSLTSFIGRERETADVLDLLRQPETRLVTITGPGGVGKTRLALAVAEVAGERYPAGTSFVSLVPIDDPSLLLPRLRSAFGLRHDSGRDPLAALAAYVRDQRLLLVLDNFEHIVEAAPDIGDLLAACPDLTILTTSRAPLHIAGEQRYPIMPLDVPEPDQRIDIEQVRRSPAVKLFVNRARAVKPEFQVDEENAEAVLEICRQLDGLPLAIELAAARIAVLSPHALLQRIHHRLPLLTGGPRDAPARQRTLRDTIAWSYDLLTAEHQRLFRGLSVFRNGWTVEAVATVVPVRSGDEMEVVEGLSTLIGHCLVVGHEQPDGEARFDMLETIREFASEKLAESREESSTRWRHAQYYKQLVEEQQIHIDGPNQIACFDRFEREHDNLRAALAWFRDHGYVESAKGMAGMLGLFWITRGYLTEGRALVDSLLQMDDEQLGTPNHARLLLTAALVRFFQGDFEDVMSMSEEAVSILERAAHRDQLPVAYVIFGMCCAAQHDEDQAFSAWERAAQYAREIGDYANLARALNNLADLSPDGSDDADTMRLLQESVKAARSSGATDVLALSLQNLGPIVREHRDYAQALAIYHEVLDLYSASGNKWGIASNLEQLAEVALALRNPESAARFTAAAAELRKRISVPVQQHYQTRYECLLCDLRSALGDEFDRIWDEGATLTIDEAIDEARSLAPPATSEESVS